MKKKLIYGDECYLSFAEYGDPDGYPILIQHGLIASIDDGDLLARLIESRARVICIARPGYGESPPYVMGSFAEWAGLVASLIRELRLTQFDILGMSSGAPYSYAIGCRFPKQARHIYIFSGIPALYDDAVLSAWPYPIVKNASMDEMQALAHELFFSHLTADDLAKNDIRDSTMNHCFGVAQDMRLRGVPWGFRLSDVRQPVFMHHSKTDDAVPFQTAVRTAELLPRCQLELVEQGPHFSRQVLDDFLRTTVAPNLGANTQMLTNCPSEPDRSGGEKSRDAERDPSPRSE